MNLVLPEELCEQHFRQWLWKKQNPSTVRLCQQSNTVKGPDLCKIKTEETSRLGRWYIILLTGLLTVPGRYRKHFQRMELINPEPLCTLWKEEEEEKRPLISFLKLCYRKVFRVWLSNATSQQRKILERWSLKSGKSNLLDHQGNGTINLSGCGALGTGLLLNNKLG